MVCELPTWYHGITNLLDNAATLGEHLLEVLRGIEGEFAQVSNSRGRGLMLAFDLPSADARDALIKALWDAKTMVLPCGSTSVRFRPFLDVSRDDVDSTLGDLLAKVKNDDDARQQFVDLLEVLGADDGNVYCFGPK